MGTDIRYFIEFKKDNEWIEYDLYFSTHVGDYENIKIK